MKTIACLLVVAVGLVACGSSSGPTTTISTTNPGSSGSSGSSGALDAGTTSATLFRSWTGGDSGSSPWKCSYTWSAIDLENCHYGDGSTAILQDTTSHRCFMIANIVKTGVSNGVETGTLVLTEKEMCRGLGATGLEWAYSYSLDYAAGALSLSTNVCALGSASGGGTMVFH